MRDNDPTPGEPNITTSCSGIVEDAGFDVDRGFCTASFPVEITTPTLDAEIYYTTTAASRSFFPTRPAE